ncbi:MAG: hypothetical protein O3C10_06290 [Chloroflexi bacterium]|nr:hypothetical protein [Chloroflexota bacterium]
MLYARPKPEEDVLPFDADIIAEYASTIRAVASGIDWKRVTDTGHRANLKYAAILLVAEELGDENLAAYVADQIKAEKAALLAGQDEELRIVVFRALLAEATDEGRLTQPMPRVNLADVKKRVRDDADWITNYMISQTISHDLGFETKKVGGPMRVMIGGRDRLKAVADTINYEDEWFEMTKEKEESDK